MAYSLFDYYAAIRKRGPKIPARDAIGTARIMFRRADDLPVPLYGRYADPDTTVIRRKYPDGSHRTFAIIVTDDSDMGAPWEEHDGHGVISDWTSRNKLPSEVEIASDHGKKRYYDIAETTKIAKRDGWGLGPDEMNRLERELCRKPTRKEIVARAVKNDCERMRKWCNDVWQWVGVQLFEMPHDQQCDVESVKYHPETFECVVSLWGIESDDYAGQYETSRELIHEV